ncbi:MAG: DUF1223 domain-containing protein [Alphaproteobacteria bacterium]|nr:DUF1223 domain-containing protein [Alphaproteobacteria bacterium]
MKYPIWKILPNLLPSQLLGLLLGQLALVLLGLFLAMPQGLAGPGKSPVVVELYTSQGCNSCPPADLLLGRLAARDDIVALTFNVDYWDYLGWKDTLAQAAHTERQRRYAASFHSRSVYTPQMVIGGRRHEVGSDASAVEVAIEAEHHRRDTEGDAAPALRIEHKNGRILVALAASRNKPIDATVWLVRYEQRRDVPIEKGENAGNKLSYFNVARDVRSLGQWHGQAMQLDLSRAELSAGGPDGCAIIVQKGPVGPVLAAARITF